MRVKLEWLNELVDLSGLTVEEIVEKISLYSTEVEGVERVLSGTNLVIGHVLHSSISNKDKSIKIKIINGIRKCLLHS
jgi:precorrin-4 methylase